MKKLTLEDVKKYIFNNDINNDCTLLSDSYINSKEKLLLKCNSCGRTFERSFANIKRNESFKCAICAQGRVLSLEDIKKFINENDINKECELLSEVYLNYNSYLDFKCNCCGKIFQRKFSQLKLGNFACYDCLKHQQGGHNRGTVEEVQNFISVFDIDKDCELLSKVYINQNEPLLFKCNCCGQEYERTFQTMKAKKAFKCFRCAHSLPTEILSSKYINIVNYFRHKTCKWKEEFLNNHKECDLTKTDKDLEIHHLINFSSILNQASINTGIPLDYEPKELEKNGYSLKTITDEFLRLHNDVPAVLLTKEYHQLFHKMYGYKNNTPEQYYEFKEKFDKGEL